MMEEEEEEVQDHCIQGDEDHALPARKRVTKQLTTAEEDHLADWFRDHPIFSDQVRKDLENAAKKQRLITSKAEELPFPFSASDLRGWMQSMRTMYGKVWGHLNYHSLHSFSINNLSMPKK